MKILLYGLNFAPELTGIGKYTGEMAAWLVGQGHEVRVVTAPPYYPAWAVGAGYSGGAYRREVWKGVQVVRCPLWVPRQPGGVKRLVHLASFALSSLPVLLAQALWRPQVVWVVEPALFCAPAACGVARLSGAKAWLHVHWIAVKGTAEGTRGKDVFLLPENQSTYISICEMHCLRNPGKLDLEMIEV